MATDPSDAFDIGEKLGLIAGTLTDHSGQLTRIESLQSTANNSVAKLTARVDKLEQINATEAGAAEEREKAGRRFYALMGLIVALFAGAFGGIATYALAHL